MTPRVDEGTPRPDPEVPWPHDGCSPPLVGSRAGLPPRAAGEGSVAPHGPCPARGPGEAGRPRGRFPLAGLGREAARPAPLCPGAGGAGTGCGESGADPEHGPGVLPLALRDPADPGQSRVRPAESQAGPAAAGLSHGRGESGPAGAASPDGLPRPRAWDVSWSCCTRQGCGSRSSRAWTSRTCCWSSGPCG